MTAEDWGKFAEGSLDLHPLRSIGHWRFETDADGKYGYLNQTMGVVRQCVTESVAEDSELRCFPCLLLDFMQGRVEFGEVDGAAAACWAIYEVSNETLEPHPIAKSRL